MTFGLSSGMIPTSAKSRGTVRRLLANTFWMLSASVAAQVLTTLALIVAARNALPEELGPVVGFVGLVSLCATFADFGLNALTVRTLAVDSSDHESFARTLSVKLVTAVALGLIWIGVCAAALALGAPRGLLMPVLPLGVYLSASVLSSTLAVPFGSAERFGPIAASLAIERLVLLAVTVVLMETLRIGMIGFGLAYMADGVAALVFLYVVSDGSDLIFVRPSLSTIVATWRGSIMFGLATVGAQIQKADVAAVAAAAGAATSGIYAIPARIVTPISTLIGAFTAAMFPMVASGLPSTRRQALLGSTLTSILTATGVGLLWINADVAVSVMLGPAYLGAVPVLRIVLLATVVVGMNQPMAVYLQATLDEAYVGTVVLAAALCGLVVVAVGASLGGAVGAAWGTVLQQVAIMAALMLRLGLRSGTGVRLRNATLGKNAPL